MKIYSFMKMYYPMKTYFFYEHVPSHETSDNVQLFENDASHTDCTIPLARLDERDESVLAEPDTSVIVPSDSELSSASSVNDSCITDSDDIDSEIHNSVYDTDDNDRSNGHYNGSNSIDVSSSIDGGSSIEEKSNTDIHDDNNSNRGLSCIALNCCGFMSKMMFPEFEQLIKKHDIICISESKLSDVDTVDIEGYTAFYKNRQKYVRKSGGILLLVKNCFFGPYCII